MRDAARSTQHAARSTQHAARSTQHASALAVGLAFLGGVSACGSERDGSVGAATETLAAALEAEVAADGAERALQFSVRSPMLDTSPSGQPNNMFRTRYVTTRLVKPLPVTFQASQGRYAPQPVEGKLDVTLELPEKASAPFALAEPASKMQLAVALEGAAPVRGTAAKNLLVYPGALGPDTFLYHSVRSDGLEDFVLVPDEGHSSVSYRVSLQNVAGLRLFENTLEFLDETGDPRLRVAPPWVVDSQGTGRWASLSVEGCKYDTSAMSPWDRPVVNPGSSSCRVTVSWDGRGLAHPVLVDPVWNLTTSMAVDRYGHSMSRNFTEGSVSKLLVCGGISASGGGTFLTQCEKRNQSTHTWSTAASMTTPRAYFVMFNLSETCALPCQGASQDTVVVAGGWTSNAGGTYTGTKKAEAYQVSTGTWNATQQEMSVPRIAPAGAACKATQYLVAGGFDGTGGTLTVHSSAQRFNFFGPWDATASMPETRAYHTATTLRTNGQVGQTNNVLVVGGQGADGAIRNTAILYNPAINGWSNAGTNTNLRIVSHSATQVFVVNAYQNHVLVAGGYTSTSTSSAVHKYDPVAQTWWFNFSNTCTARAWHTGTHIWNGVSWVGGEWIDPGSGTVASLSNTCTWDSTGPTRWNALNLERTQHAAQYVAEAFLGAVLVTGGWRSQNSQVLSSAELGAP